MRSAILFAALLPSAAAAQPFGPCAPTGPQELLDCLNGRIARLEAVIGGVPGADVAPIGGPLVPIGPPLCARWQREGEGFRCMLFKRASYIR